MIGIVGGVGPHAGIDLAKKIFDLTEASIDQEHLPVLLVSNPQIISDRTQYLLKGNGPNPANAIIGIIDQLEMCGAHVIGIPCNTLHAEQIFNKIRDSISKKITLVNMIDVVVQHIILSSNNAQKIGYLSTSGTYYANIYERAFLKQNVKVHKVSEYIQYKYIHPAIYDCDYGIKSQSNPITDKALENIQVGIEHLESSGCETIILACTELSLLNISNFQKSKSSFIDPVKLLALELIKKCPKVIHKGDSVAY
jgi:aspartate racemase